MEQRSPEWFKARLGIPTASNFEKIITKAGSPSDQAHSYMSKLICERIFKRSFQEQLDVKWVRHGRKYEDEAVKQFEHATGFRTSPVGFVTSGCRRWGCSPDRLIDAKTALEVKCPSPWRQLEYLMYGPGNNYKQQVQGQMLVGGYEKVYFFSYFPGMPFVIVETERDNKFIKSMEAILSEFSKTLDEETKKIEIFYTIWPNVSEYMKARLVIDEVMPEAEA